MAGQVEVEKWSGVGEPYAGAPHDKRHKDKMNELIAWLLMIAAVKDELVHQVEVESEPTHLSRCRRNCGRCKRCGTKCLWRWITANAKTIGIVKGTY